MRSEKARNFFYLVACTHLLVPIWKAFLLQLLKQKHSLVAIQFGSVVFFVKKGLSLVYPVKNCSTGVACSTEFILLLLCFPENLKFEANGFLNI